MFGYVCSVVIVSNQLHNLHCWCTLRHFLPSLCYIFVFDWSYVCWDFQSNTHLCLSLFSIQNVGMGNHQCLISRWPYLVMGKREVCTIEEVRICDVYLFSCLCLHCRCYWSKGGTNCSWSNYCNFSPILHFMNCGNL